MRLTSLHYHYYYHSPCSASCQAANPVPLQIVYETEICLRVRAAHSCLQLWNNSKCFSQFVSKAITVLVLFKNKCEWTQNLSVCKQHCTIIIHQKKKKILYKINDKMNQKKTKTFQHAEPEITKCQSILSFKMHCLAGRQFMYKNNNSTY